MADSGWRRFAVVACRLLWREVSAAAASLPQSFELRFLPQGLHATPERLRVELQAAVDDASAGSAAQPPAGADGMGPSCPTAACPPEAVLLGYGLCSNGLVGIEARDVPLVVPRAHDCITVLLGSKERYRELFDACPGTYWFSPGWIETGTQPGAERSARLRRDYARRFGEENADFLMETEQGWMRKYERCSYVSHGGFDEGAYRAYAQDSARYLGWTYREEEGDGRLLHDLLSGAWDDERFLVVPPGRRIAASYDEQVLRLE